MPGDGHDPDAGAAAALAAALEEAGVPHAFGGALCLRHWGVTDAAPDLALNVFLPPDALDPVLAALDRAGCTVDAGSSRPGELVVTRDGTRVHVFAAVHPYHDTVAARTSKASLPGGLEARVLSAEDLCIFKTMVYRAEDLVDLDRLFAARGAQLDLRYVEGWLRVLLGDEDPRTHEVVTRHARVVG